MKDIKEQVVAGIILGISKDYLKIPKELREFLKLDDQGIEGLDFMLRDSKLYKRIPDDVRIQYEILFANLRSELEKNIDLIKEHLEEIKKDPKPVIHDMISAATEEDWFSVF